MDSKTTINTPDAPSPIGPYSQAVKTNNMLFVSGQIALNPATGELVVNDIASETRQVMDNIAAVLKAAQLSFDHVVKCSIFVSDLAQFSAINEIYGSYFGSNAPARETVEVSKLPKNANLEISCIACW